MRWLQAGEPSRHHFDRSILGTFKSNADRRRQIGSVMPFDEFDGNFIFRECRMPTTNRRLGAANQIAAQLKRFFDALRRRDSANQLTLYYLGFSGGVRRVSAGIHDLCHKLTTKALTPSGRKPVTACLRWIGLSANRAASSLARRRKTPSKTTDLSALPLRYLLRRPEPSSNPKFTQSNAFSSMGCISDRGGK